MILYISAPSVVKSLLPFLSYLIESFLIFSWWIYNGFSILSSQKNCLFRWSFLFLVSHVFLFWTLLFTVFYYLWSSSVFLFLVPCKIRLTETFLDVGIHSYELPSQNCFGCSPLVLECCVYIFISLTVFFSVLLISSLTRWWFSSMLPNIHIFMNFPVFFL